MSLPITPGEILFEEYLKPMAISTERMARSIRVEKRIIEEILQDRRPITPELSIRFGAFFASPILFGTESSPSATFANWQANNRN